MREIVAGTPKVPDSKWHVGYTMMEVGSNTIDALLPVSAHFFSKGQVVTISGVGATQSLWPGLNSTA